MDNVYLQGRVVASGPEEAIETIHEKLKRQGYNVEQLTMSPCPVQPYSKAVWIEWLARVKSIDKENIFASNNY